MNRARPHRVVECGQQQTDHSGIDARERGLCPCVSAQPFPEWQRAGNQQERRGEQGDETHQSAQPARRRLIHGRAEKGREGEQGAGNGLRRAVPGEESLVADPARRYDFGLQQGQHDMPAAEYQRTGAIERIDDSHGLVVQHGDHERESDQQGEKQCEAQHTGTAPERNRQRIVGG